MSKKKENKISELLFVGIIIVNIIFIIMGSFIMNNEKLEGIVMMTTGWIGMTISISIDYLISEIKK